MPSLNYSEENKFYIHLFDTSRSEYKGPFPSPRRNYKEYQKLATTFPNALNKHILWAPAPCKIHDNLCYDPPKHYKVFSLHRAEDIKLSESESYQGELFPCTNFFYLVCEDSVAPKLKNNKEFEVVSEKVSTFFTEIQVKVPPESVFKFAMASIHPRFIIPKIAAVRRVRFEE